MPAKFVPPDKSPHEIRTTPIWQLRLFMLLIAIVLLSFIAWLVWAMFKFTPSSETDVIKSLLSSEMFASPDVLITSRPSDCRTEGVVKGSTTAALYSEFLHANSDNEGGIDLYRYRPRQRYVQNEKGPMEWYREVGKPVVAISRAGLSDDRALVCIEIFARHEQAFFITLRHSGNDLWLVENEVLVWEAERERLPEEFPESTTPEVSW